MAASSRDQSVLNGFNKKLCEKCEKMLTSNVNAEQNDIYVLGCLLPDSYESNIFTFYCCSYWKLMM
jgi:hypothetical protein